MDAMGISAYLAGNCSDLSTFKEVGSTTTVSLRAACQAATWTSNACL